MYAGPPQWHWLSKQLQSARGKQVAGGWRSRLKGPRQYLVDEQTSLVYYNCFMSWSAESRLPVVIKLLRLPLYCVD